MVDEIGVGHAEIVRDSLKGDRIRPSGEKPYARGRQSFKPGLIGGASAPTNALY